jgi:predicted ATPase/DNA-binding SARP family transcriptional activator
MSGAPVPILIRLLGPVDAVRDGTVVQVGGARQRTLLAVLASSRGRWVSTDQLIEAVFHGEEGEGAATTLRSYVARVRAALGPGVQITSRASGYQLDIAPEGVDATTFETLVREGEDAHRRRADQLAAARLREALTLWRGTPFGGLGTDGVLLTEARRLEELRLHALELRIEADLALGTARALVDELETLAREHPYREAFWRQLMLALYRSERQADALAAFHRARAALDDQLGIEPGAELVELEAQILRHEVPTAAPPAQRHNLPAPVTRFIGRDEELALVRDLVAVNRLVTMTGVGGVGKTRLAIETARRLAPSFADGIAFVDLAPLADGVLVPDQIATALGLREKSSTDAIDRLVGHLRDREMLLVLDNCEHLLRVCASVATRLLATCPTLRILATSRELLGVAGEAEASVPPLGIRAEGDPALRGSDAVRLFLDRARAVRPGLADDDATIASVARICTELEGIPLAIELAAARARVLSTTEIGERLHDRFRFLVSWRRLTAARHRTLREAMDWSHDLLEPAAQRLLADLSVFAGGCTLEAIEQICTFDSGATALDHVQRLVEASLVTVDQGTETTRYRLLETVREYGAARLAEAGRAEELHRRHAEHFATVAEQAWGPIRLAATQAAALARLRADRDNFRTALGWSLDRGEPGYALRITDTLWRYWWGEGESSEGQTWLERALAADSGDDPRRRARCAIGLASLRWSLGNVVAAEAPAAEARRLAEQIGDNVIAANATNTLGLIAHGREDFERARTLFEESAALTRASDNTPEGRAWNLAIAIDNLGTTFHELGDDDAARRQYAEAREINAGLADREGVAMNDLHLSVLDAEAGRIAEARLRLHSALTVYDSVGFLHYQAECLETAAAVANGLGEPKEAAYALGAAAHIHRELANQPVPFMARLREREAATARASLGDEAFEAAYADGLAKPIADAIRHVIELLAT